MEEEVAAEAAVAEEAAAVGDVLSTRRTSATSAESAAITLAIALVTAARDAGGEYFPLPLL